MTITMNMMPARRLGLALALGMLVLLAGGCPTASGLLQEGVVIEVGVRDTGANAGANTEGTAPSSPTDAETPGGQSGNASEEGGSSPTSQTEPNVPSITGEAQGQNSGQTTPPPPSDPEGPRNDPPPTDTGNPLEQEAQLIQQSLGGLRLTYLTSDSNGESYTSYREEHDLCSSGEFRTRTVSQTSGYGMANEDVYESTGTWRIAAVGAQLVLEVNTQQSSSGYSGVDQFTMEFGPNGETYLNGYRYNVTQDNPTCS